MSSNFHFKPGHFCPILSFHLDRMQLLGKGYFAWKDLLKGRCNFML